VGLSFLLSQLLVRPTSGQGEAAPPRAVGRYQMSATIGSLIVMDTTTGRCWANLDKEKWEDLGSPVEQKK
jgi:hypothetical protein